MTKLLIGTKYINGANNTKCNAVAKVRNLRFQNFISNPIYEYTSNSFFRSSMKLSITTDALKVKHVCEYFVSARNLISKISLGVKRVTKPKFRITKEE